MAIDIKRNDIQAQLWTVPGPLFVCCILLAIVLKGSFTPLMLPMIAIGGIAVCNLWKWRGVAAASAILAGAMVYSLQSLPSQSWLWTIALSLSIVSTLVLTVLCSEEAHRALNLLNKDSTDHKQTLSLLNERFQLLQAKLTAEQKEKSQLQDQLASKEERQRTNEQLLKLARKEITAVIEKQEKLTQEHPKSEQIEKLQSDLEAAEKIHQELLEMVAVQKEAIIMLTSEKVQEEAVGNSDIEYLYQQLRLQFAEKTKTLSETRRELFLAQEKLSVSQIDWVETKISNGQETLESLRRLSTDAEKELALIEHEHAIEVNHLHEVIDSLICK